MMLNGHEPATKSGLGGLRGDMYAIEKRLRHDFAVRFAALERCLAEIKAMLAALPTKADNERFMSGMEKRMGIYEEQQKRFFVQGAEIGRQGDRLDEHGRRLDDHEGRIAGLESKH